MRPVQTLQITTSSITGHFSWTLGVRGHHWRWVSHVPELPGRAKGIKYAHLMLKTLDDWPTPRGHFSFRVKKSVFDRYYVTGEDLKNGVEELLAEMPQFRVDCVFSFLSLLVSSHRPCFRIMIEHSASEDYGPIIGGNWHQPFLTAVSFRWIVRMYDCQPTEPSACGSLTTH
jgi:hypothetical protein